MKLSDAAVCLIAAYQPSPEPHAMPGEKSKSLRAAIARLEHEAVLLCETTRGCRPIHDKLQELAERMK